MSAARRDRRLEVRHAVPVEQQVLATAIELRACALTAVRQLVSPDRPRATSARRRQLARRLLPRARGAEPLQPTYTPSLLQQFAPADCRRATAANDRSPRADQMAARAAPLRWCSALATCRGLDGSDPCVGRGSLPCRRRAPERSARVQTHRGIARRKWELTTGPFRLHTRQFRSTVARRRAA